MKARIIVTITSLLVIGAGLVQAADSHGGKAGAGRLKFAAGSTWKMEESTVMQMPETPGADPATAMPPAYVAVLQYRVDKVFPDGSALVSFATLSCRKGASLKDLKDAPLPNGGKPGYSLSTRDGRVFMVQARMLAADAAEQEMMDASGNVDEVELLKASKTTAKYFEVMRNQGPLNTYCIPAKRLVVKGKAKLDGYAVTRLPDEVLDGTVCEVYRGVLDPMVETNWLDAKAGRIVKRTIVQGNPAELEITQVLMK